MSQTDSDFIAIPGLDPDHAADNAGARAARWVAYLYSGHATNEGRQAFSSWLCEDKANPRAYHALEQWWRNADQVAASDVTPEDAGHAHPEAGQESRTSRGVWRHAMIAFNAMLVVVIGAGTWQFMRASHVTETRYTSALGQIRTIALEDGSKVTLGSNTALTVHVAEDERGAELNQGQAYFDVAHDPARPFLIHVANTQVRVLGTEFEVLKREESVRVSVAKGLVGVRRVDMSSGGGQILRAGQQVSATLDGTLGRVHRFNQEQAFAWREGRLEFIGARVADIIADVNRYRADKIRMGDNRVGAINVTLSMPVGETDRLLQALEATGEVRIARDKEGVLLAATK